MLTFEVHQFVPLDEIQSSTDLDHNELNRLLISTDIGNFIKRLKYHYGTKKHPLIFLWWINPRQDGTTEIQLFKIPHFFHYQVS
ncbi:hypothetical protein A7B51_05535 [Lentilactobacillus parabuchneri]|uniref:hypothetical protein n=1 Tax=Lentilactobacillus parabuchneri TaxID=152331 RepID=UPI0007101E00|nr:hypothetical protein [Lentilactobacillus parabuchneri]MCT2884004.1 hypothetical protein [Lentilactobacillus parabuchneri]OBU97083.1 hypothetical protein A7B51_05535 [Lentilactobacillus parabuchneri]OCB81161.1 hypothetical protein A7322_12070 [Lentilactobacillus parabuchneri]OCB83525.1 hypothetical protein A8O18_10500 [Lentilactobacillus parabuchneri]